MNIVDKVEKVYHSIPQDGDSAKIQKRILEAKKYCKYYYPKIMTFVGDNYDQSPNRVMIVDLCHELPNSEKNLYREAKDFYGYTNNGPAYSRKVGDGSGLFTMKHYLSLFGGLKKEDVVYHSFILRPLMKLNIPSMYVDLFGREICHSFWDQTCTKDYVEGLKVFLQVLEACKPKKLIVLGSILEQVMYKGLGEMTKTLDDYCSRNSKYSDDFLKNTHNMSLRRRLGDTVLKRIVRAHTGEDFFESYFQNMKIRCSWYGTFEFAKFPYESWECYRNRLLTSCDDYVVNFLTSELDRDPLHQEVYNCTTDLYMFIKKKVGKKYRDEGLDLLNKTDDLFYRLLKAMPKKRAGKR